MCLSVPARAARPVTIPRVSAVSNYMRPKSFVCLCALLSPGLCAQEAVPAGAPPAAAAPASQPSQAATPGSEAQPGIETGKRIFGVLPNYKTFEKMTVAYQPLSVRTKFMIARKDSFDWPEFFVAGAMSGLNQISDQDPEWGQGVKRYAKRYGASLADQVVGNYLTEAILPSVLHRDPRYFRLGEGSAVHRVLHALS